jgi:hypothetical protein
MGIRKRVLRKPKKSFKAAVYNAITFTAVGLVAAVGNLLATSNYCVAATCVQQYCLQYYSSSRVVRNGWCGI